MAKRPDPRIRLIEKIGKLEVWLVNDRMVRDHYDSDFDQGANDLARPEWMPAWNVWISARYAEEAEIIEYHEVDERNDMYEFHYSYEHAHGNAKKNEGKIRKNLALLPKMLEGARKRCLALQEEKLGHDAEEDDDDDDKIDPEREERFTTDLALIEIITPGKGADEKTVAPGGITSVVNVYPDNED